MSIDSKKFPVTKQGVVNVISEAEEHTEMLLTRLCAMKARFINGQLDYALEQVDKIDQEARNIVIWSKFCGDSLMDFVESEEIKP